MKKFLNFVALDQAPQPGSPTESPTPNRSQFRVALYSGILSGILIGTSYIPFPPWALLFCYVPLFTFWLRTESLRSAFFAGWVAQFVFSLIGFHWIAHLAVEFGHLPLVVSWLVMLGFATFIHLHIPLMGLVFVFLRRKLRHSQGVRSRVDIYRAHSLWLLPLVAVSIESSYPMLFPWNLGYTLLWARIPTFHFADLIGFQGLSGVVFLANAILAWLWANRTPADVSFSRRWRRLAGAWALMIATLYIGGMAYGNYQENKFQPTNAPHLKVLLVQANIGNFDKFWAEKRADFRIPIIDRYERLTRAALNLGQAAAPFAMGLPAAPTTAASPAADLVLWPETAFPDALDEPFLRGPNQHRFVTLVQEANANFIIGGYSEDVRRQSSYNSIFQFDPKGGLIAKYHKRRLLAFGEYFPLSDTFPILKRLFPEIPDFNRGTSTTPMTMNIQNMAVPAALQICYEGLFPELTADFFKPSSDSNARPEAHPENASANTVTSDVIVNVTNDSWYDSYFEPHQHMTMTLARAVEFRRPLMRVTNTGISTIMLASGQMLVESPMSVEWTHIYDVPFLSQAPPTLYTQICTLMPFIYWIGLLLAWGCLYVRAKIRRPVLTKKVNA